MGRPGYCDKMYIPTVGAATAAASDSGAAACPTVRATAASAASDNVATASALPRYQLTLWATRKKQVIRLEAGAAGTSAAGLEMM